MNGERIRCETKVRTSRLAHCFDVSTAQDPLQVHIEEERDDGRSPEWVLVLQPRVGGLSRLLLEHLSNRLVDDLTHRRVGEGVGGEHESLRLEVVKEGEKREGIAGEGTGGSPREGGVEGGVANLERSKEERSRLQGRRDGSKEDPSFGYVVLAPVSTCRTSPLEAERKVLN